jgi:hypothetical protein
MPRVVKRSASQAVKAGPSRRTVSTPYGILASADRSLTGLVYSVDDSCHEPSAEVIGLRATRADTLCQPDN